jgi:hypothetical protein
MHEQRMEAAEELSQFGALPAIGWSVDQQQNEYENRNKTGNERPHANSKWHADPVRPCAAE